MMKHRFLIILLILTISCTKTTKKEDLQKYLLGKWQTTYIKIEMPTFQQSDSTHIFIDKFENNPERIVQSKYSNNGRFATWSVNRKGEKYEKSEGTWKIKGDSLYVAFFYNGKDVKEAYQIQKIANGFQGKSKYDWDNDGQFDDLLLMKTKRLIVE